MKKENDKNLQYANDIASVLKQQKDNVKEIDTLVYGLSGYENIDTVSQSVATIVNNYNNANGGNLVNKLEQREKEFTENERSTFNAIKNALENNKNVNHFQSMLETRDGTITKYEDLMIVTKIMPQLKDAKKSAVTNILSPDDLTKQIALDISFNGKPLENENPALYQEIKRIFKNYKVTKQLKHTIDRTLTLGKYYMAVVPYEKLYKQLLDSKKAHASTTNQYTSYSENASITQEENAILTENNFNELKDTFDNVSTIKKRIIDVSRNAEIITENGACHLFDEATLSKTIDKKLKNKAMKDFMKNNKINGKNVTSNDGTMDIKNASKNDEELGVLGCKIKRLDPRRLLKLEIDDTVLGYYYIETQEALSIIRDPNLFRLRANTTNTDADNGVERIYRSLGDLLLKKLDKDFISKNMDIKEQLYDILKYSDAANNKVKVIYLDAEEVEEFEIDDGESMFEQSLFYARLYMMLLLSNITAKVARSNDVRAYYVHTDAQGGVSTLINNAITTLKKNNRAFYSMTNLGKMISAFNVFDDLFIPVTQDEKKPIDFDIIQGQDIDTNNDLMEMLEKICVESSGTPLALLQTSAEPEFAKSYSMLNLKYMRMILDLQIDLNPSIESFLKMILRTEIKDEEKLSIIDQLNMSLQSPMNLLLTNTLDQINNAKDVASAVSELIYGQNPPENGAVDKFMLAVCKKYAPNVDWNGFEQIKKDIDIELTTVGGDEDDMSEE